MFISLTSILLLGGVVFCAGIIVGVWIMNKAILKVLSK